MELEEKIKQVVSNVFNVDAEKISEETSQDTLKNWNSLGHMNLVLALEEEFNIHFKDEQVIEMLSFPLVVYIVKEALG